MSLRRAAAWSLLDQVLLSALHFGVGLAVLRLSDKSDYGAYVIGWSVLMLLTGLQNAFITTQMTLRTTGLPEGQRRSLQASFLAGQFLLYAPLALAVLLSAALCAWVFPGLQKPAAMAAAVVVSFAGISLREFARSSEFAAGNAKHVLLIDAVYAAVLAFLTLACALWMPAPHLGLAALLALGAASLIAALPSVIPHWPWRAGYQTLRANSHNALWSAGGVAVTHFQSQANR